MNTLVERHNDCISNEDALRGLDELERAPFPPHSMLENHLTLRSTAASQVG